MPADINAFNEAASNGREPANNGIPVADLDPDGPAMGPRRTSLGISQENMDAAIVRAANMRGLVRQSAGGEPPSARSKRDIAESQYKMLFNSSPYSSERIADFSKYEISNHPDLMAKIGRLTANHGLFAKRSNDFWTGKSYDHQEFVNSLGPESEDPKAHEEARLIWAQDAEEKYKTNKNFGSIDQAKNWLDYKFRTSPPDYYHKFNFAKISKLMGGGDEAKAALAPYKKMHKDILAAKANPTYEKPQLKPRVEQAMWDKIDREPYSYVLDKVDSGGYDANKPHGVYLIRAFHNDDPETAVGHIRYHILPGTHKAEVNTLHVDTAHRNGGVTALRLIGIAKDHVKNVTGNELEGSKVTTPQSAGLIRSLATDAQTKREYLGKKRSAILGFGAEGMSNRESVDTVPCQKCGGAERLAPEGFRIRRAIQAIYPSGKPRFVDLIHDKVLAQIKEDKTNRLLNIPSSSKPRDPLRQIINNATLCDRCYGSGQDPDIDYSSQPLANRMYRSNQDKFGEFKE